MYNEVSPRSRERHEGSVKDSSWGLGAGRPGDFTIFGNKNSDNKFQILY